MNNNVSDYLFQKLLDMTSLVSSGMLQNVNECCLKVRKKDPAGERIGHSMTQDHHLVTHRMSAAIFKSFASLLGCQLLQLPGDLKPTES